MSLSESGILAVIDRYFPAVHPSLILGRGDDCAVLRGGAPLAVSTDIFAEHAHYRRRYFSPGNIGYKALAVNISDIGAAGARPEGFSMGLTLCGDEDEAWIAAFCEGMKELVDRFDLAVSGGDLSRGPSQGICVTAWGRLPEALPLGMRRGAAQKGDVVFVCGELGLARVGLHALEQEGDGGAEEAIRRWPYACQKHLHPCPLAEAGTRMAHFCVEHGLADRLGLMDVSDGLARDLPRLLDSGRTGLGADIFLDVDALHKEVISFCAGSGLDAASFSYAGGEDYALAGTCPPDVWEQLARWMAQSGHPIARIGDVRCGGMMLNGNAVEEKGFDHFA